MEKLEASILGTIFRNEENGYSVLTVRAGRSEHTVIGVLPELNPGEQAIFSGEWVEHKSYGRQFKCTSCEIQMPTTLLGIERYLASGAIRGIGPSTARQLVEHFGEETMEILAEHPHRLTELPGIGKKRAAMIAESFASQQGARQAIIFLQSYGIPASLALKISQRYGEGAKEVVQTNPYQLCDDLEGVGFQTADRIGIALGVAPEGTDRIRCALKYLMREAAAGAGHCYLPEAELQRQAASLLQISPALCAEGMTRLLLSRELVAEMEEGGSSRRFYLPEYYRAEQEVALRIQELMAAIHPGAFRRAARAIAQFEASHSIHFSPRQKEAITQALETGVFVITGGPGTGKTTIINCILSLLSQENEVLLCAPTGRAAKRMTEATGAEAKTIHRLLEFNGEEGVFARNVENPLEADCVIADEASMIDLSLMKSLLRAISPGARLILVGDADQLPSVGAGNVLGDILASGAVPCARLTDIYRQSEQSRIVLNAHLINRGEMPLLNEKGTDFFFERKPLLREAAATVVSLVKDRLPGYLGYPPAEATALATRNIQVLAPAKKGECGVLNLNVLLQEALNPPSRTSLQLTWGENTFRLGDKVIQTRNNYDLVWHKKTAAGWEDGSGIFNGDIGFIIQVDPGEHTLVVRFDEDRDVLYESSDLEDLSLAYCLSVHKSQGSEFPVVIMPVTGGPPMLLTRNLFYTALTRAKALVVLVGTESVIQTMVQNDHIAKRYTTLALRLSAGMYDL
ncbi:MAG: ATP-dependent RecD-like DNA helicase [Clostridia bacterium]|nr:ATP-dependent RecD-like DNA helicase [Clostridia bacterium]